MKIAVDSFVNVSSNSVNQYRNQRPYLILSFSGIPRIKIGRGPNKSKISVMHSYDFQLPFVLVTQHSRNSFDCLLNENCSVLQSVQKNTAHQQCTSRGLASFSIPFGFVYLYRHHNCLLCHYHSSLFYSTYLFHTNFNYKHTCNLHTTECIGFCIYYKALNKTYSCWFLVVFTAKTEHRTFTANVKQTAIRQKLQ